MQSKKLILLGMVFSLMLGIAGCTPSSSQSESLDGIPDRWTTEEEKIVVFAEGEPEGFWARNDRGNGGMFNCSFGKENAKITDGYLTLTLDKQNDRYVGAEYRTYHQYSYGFYSVSMKPAKCAGVITSFFTYTGRPWDEIDIEFLGNDTTKVQFNYFVSGEGGHEYVYDLGFDASEKFHEYAFAHSGGIRGQRTRRQYVQERLLRRSGHRKLVRALRCREPARTGGGRGGHQLRSCGLHTVPALLRGGGRPCTHA